MIAASGPTALWYATRSTGYVSLLLLTAILVLGVVTSLRLSGPQWPRFVTQALHRNLSLLVLVFLAIHIVTSVADPFAGIQPLNAVAPFTGSYRPVWVGLGVVSTELLVALVVTSLLRQRIGFRAWRFIHWAAYASWPIALLHTLGTGSDIRSGWAVLLSLGCVAAVVIAVVWRVTTSRPRAGARLAGLAATAAVAVGVAGFAVAGPLRSGWAKAAGTPPRLLADAAPGGTASSPSAAPAPALAAGLADQLTGTVAQSEGGVEVALTDTRDTALRLIIDVARGASSGRLTITRAGATLCSATASITEDVLATCGQTAVDVSVTQQDDGTIAGRLTTRAATG